jgi:hypothetical protein
MVCTNRCQKAVLDVTAESEEGITAAQGMFNKLRSALAANTRYVTFTERKR